MIAVLGPTAAGKSALGLALAERFGGEIVNCDSTAVYRGFDIGTDKVPAAEQRGIPHHLIDIVEPTAEYSAADYARDATAAIRDILARAARADPGRRHRLLLSGADTRAVSGARQGRGATGTPGVHRDAPRRRAVCGRWSGASIRSRPCASSLAIGCGWSARSRSTSSRAGR